MHGCGIFFWKDGRSYKGEYYNDKKQGFGVYDGGKGKKYEGYWEDGLHKGLGKYTKNDGSFKIGYWLDTKIQSQITEENELEIKLEEIDISSENCLNKVDAILDGIKTLFSSYLPNIDFEEFLIN